MKHFLTLFAICLFTVSVHCQIEWAKTGTVWVTYHLDFNFQYTIKKVVTGDTTIVGKTCKIIYSSGNSFPPISPETNFTYEENGKIYFYNNSDSTFALAYDFIKEAGEQWKIPFGYWGADSLTIVVDSVSYLDIDNFSLRVQHVRSQPLDCGEFMEDEIIAGIGARRGFSNLSCLQADIYSELTCFKSPDYDVWQFSNSWLDCDSLTTANREISLKSFAFHISPNPATTETTLTYHLPPNLKAEIRIFNALGSQLAEYPTVQAEGTLTLPDYPAGVYFVSLLAEGRVLRTERLLKF